MKQIFPALLSLSALCLLVGCGGSGTATDSSGAGTGRATPGGGGVGSAGNGGSVPAGTAAPTSGEPGSAATAATPFTPVAVFLLGKDTPQPSWGHLWATVYKIEGVGQDNKAVVLFQSGEGVLVDLTRPSALPGAGAALSSLPAFNRLRITLAPAVQASKPDPKSAVETFSLLPALPKDAEGRAVATLSLNKPFSGAALSLVAELAHFQPNEGKAGLELQLGEPPTESLTVQVLGQLTSGGRELLLPGGARLALTAEAAQLTNADGTPRPKLVEGQLAQVEGQLSPEGKTLTASRVTLGTPEAAQLEGTAQESDSKLNSFTLSLSQASGILPTRLTIPATLAEKAALRGRGGLPLSPEAFLAALAQPNTRVHVEGSYEPATGALTVRRGWLLGKAPREARVVGTVLSEEKTGALSLSQPTDWDGFAPSERPTPLTTSEATLYLDEKGSSLSREGFLAGVKERPASVVGLLDGDGRLAATKLTLLAPLPKPETEKKPEPVEKKPEPVEKKPEAEKKPAVPELPRGVGA